MKQIRSLSFFVLFLFSALYSWGQPSLNFGTSGNASGCAPQTVLFNIGNTSTNSANTTYVLNFGDGSSSISYTQATIPTTVSHTYTTISCGQTYGNQPNCFGATLTATNTSGPSTATVFPIRISKKPNASMTLSSSSIIVGSTITFSNISDPGVTYTGTTCNTNPPYYWAVTGPSAGTVVSGALGSNGGFPTNVNAWTSGSSPLTMQFTTPGSYQMKLSTGNSCGIDDTTLNFQVVNNACLLSVQDVNYCNTSSAVLGVGMQLTLASVPITNSITSYSWTGPNGFTTTAQYPIIPSPVNPGNYTLTIQAPGCVSDASDITINVSTTANNCPTAAFTASPAVVCDGATTTFTNQTAGAGNSYFWLFGDGTTSTLANPTHVYNVPVGTGTITFTATLVVTNAAGRMDIVQQVITVRQIPAEPTITSNQLQLYNGQEYVVSCTDDLTGDIFLSGVVSSAGSWIQSNSINWGDGSPIFNFTTFPVPCFHSYNKGLFTLQITLNGPNGCSVSNAYSVFVGGTPAINLSSPGNTEQCAPFTFNFPISNTANNSAGTTYTATFSDGGATQIFNHPPPAFFSHTFTESSCGEISYSGLQNAFWVQLTAQNPCDAAISTLEPFRISKSPFANYTALPSTACVNNPVSINNSADPGNNVNSSGCNTNHGMVWSISPASGWSLTSGALGSTNGQPTNYLNWTSGSNQLALTFSSPGNYIITQRIRNSCGEDVDTNSILITSNSNIVDAEVDQSFCLGSAPLQLTGTPLGGTWSGSTAVTFAGVFSPTAIGTYTLTYTFGTGSCTSSDQKVVTVYAPPTVSVNDPTICSGNQAVLTAFGSGGLAPYSYSWSPAAGLSASSGSSVITSPTASTSYTVTVSDARSCTATDVSTITVNPIPIVNAGSDFSICNGSGANTLSGFTPTGGIWSGLGVTSSGVFTPVGVGNVTLTYSVIQNGCIGTDQIIVTVIAPTAANAGADQGVCLNAPAINLTGTPSGGNWVGSTLVTSAGVFTPSTVGTYTLTYTFGTGSCTATDQKILTVHALPTVTVNDPTICAGAQATLTAAGAGGLAPYTYAWSPSAGLSSSIGAVVTTSPNSSTSYTVTVSDARFCTATDVSAITVNPIPTVNAGSDVSICNGSGANTLTGFTPSGGTWSGTGVTSAGVFTPTALGNVTLTYSFTQIGCTGTDQIVVTVIAPTAANAGADQGVCLNAPAINLTGTPSGGNWVGSTLVTSAGVFTPSTVGTYTLTYTFGTGSCTATDQKIVTVHALPTVAVNDPTICAGAQATLTAAGSGGLSPYTYAWAPSAGLSSAAGATVTTSPSASTSYTVTVSDARSCTATNLSSITVNPLPTVNAGLDISLCNTPNPNILIGFSPSSGIWSGLGVTSSGVFTPVGVGNVTLTYSVIQNGCIGTDQIIVSVVSPVIPYAGVDQSLCIGSSPILLNGIPVGGVWSGAPLVNSEGVFSPNTVGSYSLVYSIGVGSCLVSDELNIQVVAIPSVAFALEDTLFCTSDAAINLSSGTPAGGVYFGSGVNGNQFDPSLTFVGESTIGYSYTDFNGCSNLVNENIAVEICAFIANSEMSKSFHVYPNPSSGTLNIQLQDGYSFAEMSLFSLDGKLIIHKQLNASNQSFDFSVLSSGFYFIRLQNKEEIISLPWYKFN